MGRLRLLAVLSFPDTDEVEVHLVHGTRRAIGRAAASGGLVATASATLAAVTSLGVQHHMRAAWIEQVHSNSAAAAGESAGVEVVTVALEATDGTGSDGHDLYGVSSGASTVEAAARATLSALNRRLSAKFGALA